MRPGRPKGSRNKKTVAVKEALENAFAGMGGTPALIKWAKENPTEFFKIWSKLLPIQIASPSEGEAEPLAITFGVREPVKEVRTTNAGTES